MHRTHSISRRLGHGAFLTGLSASASYKLIESACDSSPVVGLTHNFYRYPARFSPILVRSTIDAFTDPGDLVLDPFVGGGTTLVESLASGRNAIGTDISALATFISSVKTTIFSDAELDLLQFWANQLESDINLRGSASSDAAYKGAGYLRHLDMPTTWRIRKAVDQAIESAEQLETQAARAFGRCAILNTAQWAIDRRRVVPKIEKFREALVANVRAMVAGAHDLRLAANQAADKVSEVHCLHRPSSGIEKEKIFSKFSRKGAPKLIVTSPPYPGVHVLYHRWQVDGGKETPAPFWIANQLDGDGAAYYTMGGRSSPELDAYFNNLRDSLKSVAAISDSETVIVQVVAFSNPAWQLPRYLSIADEVGLMECRLSQAIDSPDGRLWRTVPNRKWYADQRGDTNGSQEVVLFHRRKD